MREWKEDQKECVDISPTTCKTGAEITKPFCEDCGTSEECGSAECVYHQYTSQCIAKLTKETRSASLTLKEYKGFDNTLIKKSKWVFQKMTPLAVAQSTYFALQYDHGYTGIQRLPPDPGETQDKGRILFSIWDNCKEDKYKNTKSSELPSFCKAEMVLRGTNVQSKGFDGEGEGKKLQLDIDDPNFPAVGEDYHVALQASEGGDEYPNSALYTAYCWFDGKWKFLGRLKAGLNNGRENQDKKEYDDWWINEPQSFVEAWSHLETEKSRKGSFGPAYMVDENGDFHQTRQAKFSYDERKSRTWSREHIDAKIVGDEIIMETGGDAVQSVKNNHVFQFGEVATPPLYEDLKTTIETCEDNHEVVTAEIIESCLSLAGGGRSAEIPAGGDSAGDEPERKGHDGHDDRRFLRAPAI